MESAFSLSTRKSFMFGSLQQLTITCEYVPPLSVFPDDDVSPNVWPWLIQHLSWRSLPSNLIKLLSFVRKAHKHNVSIHIYQYGHRDTGKFNVTMYILVTTFRGCHPPVLCHGPALWSPPSGSHGDSPTHVLLQLTFPSSSSRRHLGIPSFSISK